MDFRKLAGDGDRVATGYGVFFVHRRSAEIFAKQRGGELEEMNGGWFVKRPIAEPSDDDPIVQIIKEELRKAGLTA
jgi:hypothetical protein